MNPRPASHQAPSRLALLALAMLTLAMAFADAASADEAAIEGYVAPLSMAPGETLSIMVSSPVPWQLRFARYHRQGAQNVPEWMSAPIDEPAGVPAVPDSAWHGCSWPATDRFVVPADWPSGIYAAECSAPGLATHRIAFVVRPPPGAHGEFAILANTNTWNAYNAWGGRSKYTDPPAHYLSALRPNPAADPVYGSTHLARAEVWVHDFLATSGYRTDTYTDWDMHRGIAGMDAYRALILDTHAEYWSPTMLDRLQDYLAHGGCVLDIAGNAIFETVRFSPEGTLLTMFPERYCGSSACRRYSYFRNLFPSRPERAVLGVAYRSDAYGTFAPFRVLASGHRFFAGTGLVDGDSIGMGGLNGPASGWEMDTSLPGWMMDGPIVSCLGADDRGLAPANLELLARGTNLPTAGADMTWYSTPAGGGVFAAGSISFGGSLAVDSTLQHVIRNVLDEFLSRGLAVGPSGLPVRAALGTSAPNPFSLETRIAFALERPTAARLRVYDVASRLVRTLLDGPTLASGPSAVTWDGRDDSGRSVSDGVYFVRLDAGDQHESRRLLRLH